MTDPNDDLLLMHTLATMDDAVSSWDEFPKPAAQLREGLFEKVFPPAKAEAFLRGVPHSNAVAVVVADESGLIEWISPAFTRMCGYTLQELRGRRPGKMLQGADTTAESVEILRSGIREHRRVEAQVVNYHKSGDRYVVNIEIFPLISLSGADEGFIAIEHEIVSHHD